MSKKTTHKTAGNIETQTVGNYEKHPFFVKKNDAARFFLKKAGIPDSYKAKLTEQ